ncbi:MAG: hypothetical protein ACFHVJ_01655 [Aestuariibacter sp.]
MQPEFVLTGHDTVADLSSANRDIQFLTEAWKLVGDGHQSGKTEAQLQTLALNALETEFRQQYSDFDTGLSYLIRMM